VQLAKEAMIATLRWRDEFDVEAACREEFPEEVFGGLGNIFGVDKDKRPVTYVSFTLNGAAWAEPDARRYNLYGRMSDVKTVFGDKQRFIRCVSARAFVVWGVNRREGGASSLWRRESSCSTLRPSTRWSRCMVRYSSTLMRVFDMNACVLCRLRGCQVEQPRRELQGGRERDLEYLLRALPRDARAQVLCQCPGRDDLDILVRIPIL
jgi:hypothetical protein